MSCGAFGDSGAVIGFPQAATVPSNETARMSRTTSWRVMHSLREEGERDACHQLVERPVTGRYLLTRQVT